MYLLACGDFFLTGMTGQALLVVDSARPNGRGGGDANGRAPRPLNRLAGRAGRARGARQVPVNQVPRYGYFAGCAQTILSKMLKVRVPRYGT